MHFYFTLLLMLLICRETPAQIKLVSIEQFGAKANDNISDQAAFNKAASYINQRGGNVRLTLSSGNYLVGPGYDYKAPHKNLPLSKLWDVVALVNCKQVSIEGTTNTTISFLNNIPFGRIAALPDRRDSSVHIGSLFRLTNCKNVNISNIKANGNNSKFRLLYNWGVGANPYEREHEGLFILNCQDMKVKNVDLIGFGRDGLMILQDPDKIPVKNLAFSNCKFNNNGRNGVSWCGGENVSFYNCTFNENASGKIITNPGSGLDIEPEREAMCKGGSFIKCEFTRNGGYAVTSAYTTASNVRFDSCRIYGNSNYSLIVISPGFTFTNSSFAGTALFTYDASSLAAGTKIIGCSFTDSLKGQKVFKSNYLVSVQGRYIHFTDCIFTGYHVPSIYTEVKKKEAKVHPENTIFERCSFNALFRKNTTWDKWPFLVSNTSFVDCVFRSVGFADFKHMLGQGEKNIHQKQQVCYSVTSVRFNKNNLPNTKAVLFSLVITIQ